jgi:hypothetical protein
MITAADLLHLPFTPDLTAGGITCACRSLIYDAGRGERSQADCLRSIVAEMAVELAFRRHLSAQDIPFHLLESAPFSRTDRYSLSLGGHRCELKSFLISRREHILQLGKRPALALKSPALVPIEEFAKEDCKPDDITIFGLLLGVVASTWEEVDKAAAAGQPLSLVHQLPERWSCPEEWRPLEKLVLKSEDIRPIRVEIGGQDSGREFIATTLDLPPKTRVPADQNFNSLAYVQAASRPRGRIGLHSPSCGEATIIAQQSWSNIWVYGMDILLMGWLSHEEYQRKAKVLNAGMKPFLHDRTGKKNLLVPMEELNPLGPLFSRIRAWAGGLKKS